jgi:GntP family gluconate:H+ symporter
MWKIFGGMPAAGETSVLRNLIDFIGDKNIALLIGALLSMWLLKQSKGIRLSELGETLAKPLETAGLVILITSAGGAFGSMIKNAGVGSAVKHVSEGVGISMILLAYVISLVMRVAQGSSTVAMITTSAIMYPLLGADLPYHPIYIYLSIGFASFALGWMNDSGFWVVSRLSGMTEKETLKYFSMMLSMLSLLGLAVTWLGSVVLPLVSK